MFGYGQRVGQADTALRIEAQNVQISAPSGLVSRGMTVTDTYYRLRDQGQQFVQARLLGQLPERVLLSKADAAQQPIQTLSYMATQTNTTPGWTQAVQSSVSMSPAGSASDNLATRNYLNQIIRPVIQGIELAKAHQAVWVNMANELKMDEDLLLSDLSYGFSETGAASFLLGAPGVQPLSSGVPATSDVWFDYMVQG